jgi:hypothetical protein
LVGTITTNTTTTTTSISNGSRTCSMDSMNVTSTGSTICHSSLSFPSVKATETTYDIEINNERVDREKYWKLPSNVPSVLFRRRRMTVPIGIEVKKMVTSSPFCEGQQPRRRCEWHYSTATVPTRQTSGAKQRFGQKQVRPNPNIYP